MAFSCLIYVSSCLNATIYYGRLGGFWSLPSAPTKKALGAALLRAPCLWAAPLGRGGGVRGGGPPQGVFGPPWQLPELSVGFHLANGPFSGVAPSGGAVHRQAALRHSPLVGF